MNKDSVKNLAILSKDSYNVGSGQEQKETQMNLSICCDRFKRVRIGII